MARYPTLNKEQEKLLEVRISLAKSLGTFSISDLWSGWGISKATLYRYHSPVYREASRKYSQKAYLSYRKALIRGVCYRCHDPLSDHSRCEDCEILLHVGSVFGDTSDGKICTGCFDTNERRKMRGYEKERKEEALLDVS